MKAILVPTDFSTNANNALKYANAFAQAAKNKLVLLNVYKPIVGKYNIIPGIIAEETATAKMENQKKLKNLHNKYVKVACAELVNVGDPIDEIINTSKKNRTDIIIMGTHGATGLQEALFGSNTAKLISKSKLPVLAIPQRYRFKKIKTIVYASDLKNPVNELKLLIPIAKSLNATIEILNLNYGWDKNENKRKTLEGKIKSLSYKKIKLVEQKANIEQSMSAQIKKYLKKRKPEIFAMFPEEKSWFDKIFISSKTEELAYQLKVPLLSIRKSIVNAK
ncbi:MAG: universal stress protein [Flavobacteriales bacterium]|nr:universal stress protein [Flavobacteriales bacterium]